MDGATYLRLTPGELSARRRAGERWQLLDVREPWELARAEVGADAEIPLHQLPARVAELDRREAIAVLCHTGARSAVAAAWLSAQGFRIVANVEGGIDAWSVELDASIPRY